MDANTLLEFQKLIFATYDEAFANVAKRLTAIEERLDKEETKHE